MINVATKISKKQVGYKAGAFADDIYFITCSDIDSIQKVFSQNDKLSKKSGLILNADKTEILALHTDREMIFNINYDVAGKVLRKQTG